jgi:hypothetical protein
MTKESISGILALIIAAFAVADACLIVFSYIYSRFIFNGYLKRNHRKKWEELVYTDNYWGPGLFCFDKTAELAEFRTKSKEDLGDPTINRMRRTSIYLFKVGILAWIGLVVISVVGFAVFYLLR